MKSSNAFIYALAIAASALLNHAANAQTSSTATPDARGQITADSSADTVVIVSFGGLIDSYYAYDFGRPRNFDRPFTTTAARHNEFNVNLAYIEAKVSGPRVRGRLALQTGTSVQSNYAAEPTIGAVSGPNLSRFIQEAFAGYQISPNLWIDGGIFFSHIGEEGFISRDNLTYTRSLSSDYTPYYESGVKLTWQATPKVSALLTIVNGWQNISENNQDKGVGARLDYSPSASTRLSYYDFVGNEAASGLLRVFNGIGIHTSPTAALTIQWNFDDGTQEKTPGGHSTWFSTGLIGKSQLTPLVGVSGRVERYQDPDNVIVATAPVVGFKATTASLGVDVSPLRGKRALWRSELRGTWAAEPVFPSRAAVSRTSRTNGLIVTSLALSL